MNASARRLARALVALLALLVVMPAHGLTMAQEADPSAVSTGQIPDDALWVGAGHPFDSIEDALAAAATGATVAVDGGDWTGPLLVAESIRLIGVNDPVIDGQGQGTVVRITAPDVTIQGFTIQNSGSSLDREDSAVVVEAERVHVLDNTLLDTLFGVNTAKAHDGVIAGNRIVGKDLDMGVRGDGIKVWYSHRIVITGNDVDRSRDLLVWYSNDVVVSDNHVRNGRYGFHFMNSDNGVAERNRMVDNSVAVYLMYGRNFTINDNLLQGSRGPSGHGLGLKEIDGVTVEGNIIYDNRIGIFIDNTPLSPNAYSHIRGNLIAYNDLGLAMLPATRNNVIAGNSMIDNLEQVAIMGGGKLGDNQWSENGTGNFWSDFAGYDADGDGIGDVAFRSEQLSEQVLDSWPILQLFRFSVAEAAVDFGSRAVPMFRQEPKLVDEHPLVAPVIPANAPLPAGAGGPAVSTAGAILLLTASSAALWWGARGTRFPGRRQDTPNVPIRPTAIPCEGQQP